MERNITVIAKISLVVITLLLSIFPVHITYVSSAQSGQEVIADFTWTPLEPNQKIDTVTFDGSSSTATDGDVVNWTWDFGDGAVAYGENTTHIYNNTRFYLVNLMVTDDKDTSSWKTHTIYVKNTAPSANFTLDPMHPMVNETISLTDLSSDADGEIVLYHWDFGDGTTSTNQTPNHTYVENGTYTVTLTVTDDDNATDSTTQTIIVGSVPITNLPPVAAFTFYQGLDVANGNEINITLRVSGKKYRFVNLTVYEDGVEVGFVSVERIPGDPKEQENTTKVPIDSSRLYIILLEYTPGTSDEDDDDDKNGGIPIWVTVECLDIIYEEHFVFHGGEEEDEGEKDENDEEGEKKEFNLTEILDVMIRSARIVKFDASASYDPDDEIVLYHWDFGDGTTSTNQTPNHTYVENGTYTVTLTVTDDDNATDSTTQTVLVGSVPPIADFSYDPMVNITIKMTIMFTDHSTDIDGIISSWYWNFGDGTTSDLQNPTHVYNRMGSYQVTLIVTDNDGQSSTKKSIIHVVSTPYDTDPDNIIEVTLEYNSNYIAWEGQPLNASDLAAYASLSYGDSISLFDKKNGCWEEYVVGFSNASDDFLISTWDAVNIKCVIGKKILVDISKIDDNAQNITLNFTYNPQTKEGNRGYNFFIWSKNQIITAKDLAENLSFSDENIAISKYFPDSNTWETYNPSLPVVFKTNFNIYPYDVVCVKLLKTSLERTLLIN